MIPPTSNLSRRRFLLLTGAGGITAAAALLLPGWMRRNWPYAPDLDDQEVEAVRLTVLLSSVTFLGALFGRALTPEDQDELRERLEYTVEREPQRLEEYALLTRYLDRSAGHRGAASFASAGADIQAAVLDALMTIRHDTLVARLLSRLSLPAARHFRMRSATVPALAWLYAHSGAAWRARGYERWPGIPGNWRDVLSPGKPYP